MKNSLAPAWWQVFNPTPSPPPVICDVTAGPSEQIRINDCSFTETAECLCIRCEVCVRKPAVENEAKPGPRDFPRFN